MAKIFGSPSRYIQGPDALKTESHYLELGRHGMLVTDERVWTICGAELTEQLRAKGLEITPVFLQSQSSEAEMIDLVNQAQGQAIDFVLALGGGKAIDLGKSVSHRLNLPVAVVPTAASTDAPTSAISVMYSQEGLFEAYRYDHKNPDIVLVDTSIIIQAPAFLLVSGIADALATYVEVRTVVEEGANNLLGGQPTIAAVAIAEKCQELLFEFGIAAVADNQNNELTPAFEAIVEANTLLSGIGFESGGLAAAHAIQNGLSVLPGKVQTLSHGQKVAFGTLTQLVLEKRPISEIDKFVDFYRKLGLPTTLAQLFVGHDRTTLNKIAIQATVQGETSHNLAGEVTPERLIEALLEADKIGSK